MPGFADDNIKASAGALTSKSTTADYVKWRGSNEATQKALKMQLKRLYAPMPAPFVPLAEQNWKNSATAATWFTVPAAGKGGRCVAGADTTVGKPIGGDV